MLLQYIRLKGPEPKVIANNAAANARGEATQPGMARKLLETMKQKGSS